MSRNYLIESDDGDLAYLREHGHEDRNYLLDPDPWGRHYLAYPRRERNWILYPDGPTEPKPQGGIRGWGN